MTFFNDSNKRFVGTLQEVIGQIPRVETLKVSPEIRNFEVGQEVADWLESGKLIPSLIFLDPWGYKGLSLNLVNATTRDWGCDTILFFNYNRVNMGLGNPAVEETDESHFRRRAISRVASKGC